MYKYNNARFHLTYSLLRTYELSLTPARTKISKLIFNWDFRRHLTVFQFTIRRIRKDRIHLNSKERGEILDSPLVPEYYVYSILYLFFASISFTLLLMHDTKTLSASCDTFSNHFSFLRWFCRDQFPGM